MLQALGLAPKTSETYLDRIIRFCLRNPHGFDLYDLWEECRIDPASDQHEDLREDSLRIVVEMGYRLERLRGSVLLFACKGYQAE